jgi:hypothetical protein
MAEASVELPRVVELLRETHRAHHAAFMAVDGDDPEWPAWYARYMIEPLRALGLEVTSVQSLSAVLDRLNTAYTEAAPNLDWPTYYAQGLLQRFS